MIQRLPLGRDSYFLQAILILTSEYPGANVQAIKLAAEGAKGAAGSEGGPTENGDSAEGKKKVTAAGDAMEQEDEEEEEEDEAGAAMMPIRGPLPPEEGTWASCVRLLDPVEGATVECLELGEGRRVRSEYPCEFLLCNCWLAWFRSPAFVYFSVSLALLGLQLPGVRPSLPVSMWQLVSPEA